MGRSGIRRGVRKIGASTLQSDIVIFRIQFDQQISGFDQLVVIRQNPHDRAGNSRAHRIDMAIGLSVIGALPH